MPDQLKLTEEQIRIHRDLRAGCTAACDGLSEDKKAHRLVNCKAVDILALCAIVDALKKAAGL